MPAYYNEIDAYAAAWLRNLIAAGHIASGEVDERSIVDVRPSDLDGFDQCHFFAGIGVWSSALRLAEWSDDRPVWTGSCPCQPFSAAGKGGGFADERHLWPAFFHLIGECRPAVVLGEQVASRDGLNWLDLVQDDMEGAGYAFGAVDTSSALHGAPHIRQRLRWVAYADAAGRRVERRCRVFDGKRSSQRHDADGRGTLCDVADTSGSRLEGSTEGSLGHERPPDERGRGAGGLADADGGHGSNRDLQSGWQHGQQPQDGLSVRRGNPGFGHNGGPELDRLGPTNGFWRDPDWLFCRDGRWRPVSASPQPLVDGSAESLGRVRPDAVAAFEEEIDAWAVESQIDRDQALRGLLAHLGTEAQRCWAPGRLPGLHEAPFLLAYLRQLQEQGWRVAQRLPLSCEEVREAFMRGVRLDAGLAGSPRRHGLEEQRSVQPSDPLSVLSSLLARHTRSSWDRAHSAYAESLFPLAVGAPARVGRLRAYGNAVDREATAAFIRCLP